MKRLALVFGLLGVLLSSAFGQEKLLVQAKIPFEFAAHGKTLPAGSYQFRMSNNFIEVRNEATGEAVVLGYITRIAADDTARGRARVSFGVHGDKHFVEAIWPAEDDGYLLQSVKGEHTHQIARSE